MSLAPGTTPPVDTLGHKHHDLRMHQPPPAAVLSPDWLPTSPRLYNQDLAPTKAAGRRWTGYSFFTLWANDVHSLGNYGFALGLFALGLGGWQILLALAVGAALLFLLLTLSGIRLFAVRGEGVALR